MFAPGPRTTLTPSAMASRPIAHPTCSTSSGFQVAARADEVGKQVAGTLSARSMEPVAFALRNPYGPSVTTIDGTPRRSTPLRLQKSRPESSATFSSSVIAASTAGGSKGVGRVVTACTSASGAGSWRRAAGDRAAMAGARGHGTSAGDRGDGLRGPGGSAGSGFDRLRRRPARLSGGTTRDARAAARSWPIAYRRLP